MTTLHAGYVVTLAEDTREDDAERIVAALSMVKGVLRVEPVVADYGTAIAETRARFAIAKRLMALVGEIHDGK